MHYRPLCTVRIPIQSNHYKRLHGKSAAQVCLRWLVLQRVSAIPRTSRLERLSENIEVFDFALSEGEMAEISALGSRDGRLTDFGFSPKWD